MVTVVERQGVKEGRTARITVFLDGLKPALQHGGIVINRRAVEAQQSNGKTSLIHQRCLHTTLFTHLFQEVTELAVMSQHQMLRKAQFGEVIKQITLIAGRLIQILMRCLTAACTQQADCCRAAVRGGRVKIFKLNVEMRPQRMGHQTGCIHIGP